MDLLAFARGPGLVISFAVFVAGTLWRLYSIWRLPPLRDLSPAREGAPSRFSGAIRAIRRGMWPRQEFGQAARLSSFRAYAFHIGLALIFFGYAPHIAFIRRETGLHWPALPDIVTYLAAAATIVALLLALWARIGNPVLKKISRADDYITWTITFLPVLTGMAIIGEPSDSVIARAEVLYRTPLAVHLLSLELLLLWFPFGKLMHTFLFAFSRGATGARFSHRGVEA